MVHKFDGLFFDSNYKDYAETECIYIYVVENNRMGYTTITVLYTCEM